MRLYSQLVSEFMTLIDVLTEISEDLNFIETRDLPGLMERWKKTGISKYRKLMHRHGVVPIEQEPDW